MRALCHRPSLSLGVIADLFARGSRFRVQSSCQGHLAVVIAAVSRPAELLEHPVNSFGTWALLRSSVSPSRAVAIELPFLRHHRSLAHLAVGILGPSGETAGQFQLLSVSFSLCLCCIVCVHRPVCHRALLRLGALSAPFWATSAAGVSAHVLSRIGLSLASLHFCFWRPEEVHKIFSSIFLLTFDSTFFSRAIPLDFSLESIRPSSRDRGGSVGSAASKRIGLEN